jgi:hypothetical protein
VEVVIVIGNNNSGEGCFLPSAITSRAQREKSGAPRIYSAKRNTVCERPLSGEEDGNVREHACPSRNNIILIFQWRMSAAHKHTSGVSSLLARLRITTGSSICDGCVLIIPHSRDDNTQMSWTDPSIILPNRIIKIIKSLCVSKCGNRPELKPCVLIHLSAIAR